ncbi:inositol monophosphatase family protein [Aquibacillus salsiterrae]|uniref:Inositol monophosphatase family protein n=1 Tax=Aquibacillus salsiterrae TaxID=2950439 RepID=A0A9X3WFK5_9BACI|nr:inositol monophosphatase family protein [Aquibacillus salsiterrae]MDC3416524.1 inositol monophosphatase family protein [Aquibacillus salsiterrae]
MKDQLRQDIYNHAKNWILEAGKHLRDVIDEPLYIDTKSNPNDLVTQMDRETEQFFTKHIKETYPDHRILSEEGFGDDVTSLEGFVWIIDPIDGTMNFVHQKKHFAISIGIYHEGIGQIGLIYNVMEDILYSSIKGQGAYKNNKRLPKLDTNLTLEESILVLNSFWACENSRINETKIQQLIKKVRGTRSYGSAALEFAYVAEGIADGYLSMQLAPWDYAAGVLIMDEVGGITTKADGAPIDILHDSTIFSCNRELHDEITVNYVELKQ